ncbi:hypothetical protein [Leisingera sp. JC11]|uniref:hypothetical protein n=1 Tax=Leisingera sp. JC11 TaxID=3042469 RepID=UPI003452B4FF
MRALLFVIGFSLIIGTIQKLLGKSKGKLAAITLGQIAVSYGLFWLAIGSSPNAPFAGQAIAALLAAPIAMNIVSGLYFADKLSKQKG